MFLLWFTSAPEFSFISCLFTPIIIPSSLLFCSCCRLSLQVSVVSSQTTSKWTGWNSPLRRWGAVGMAQDCVGWAWYSNWILSCTKLNHRSSRWCFTENVMCQAQGKVHRNLVWGFFFFLQKGLQKNVYTMFHTALDWLRHYLLGKNWAKESIHLFPIKMPLVKKNWAAHMINSVLW